MTDTHHRRLSGAVFAPVLTTYITPMACSRLTTNNRGNDSTQSTSLRFRARLSLQSTRYDGFPVRERSGILDRELPVHFAMGYRWRKRILSYGGRSYFLSALTRVCDTDHVDGRTSHRSFHSALSKGQVTHIHPLEGWMPTRRLIMLNYSIHACHRV
jgi:hypothetical protein